MTEHINTKATRLPPVTYGGFVGEAAIDPGYAVKVKETDTVVDIRDFSPTDGTLNLRDRTAASALRNFRRWDIEHRLMRQANIPASDTLYLPNTGTIINGMVTAQITAYKKHMIGSDNSNLTGNVLKLKKALTVRAVYSASTSVGQTIFKTVEIDPTTCILHDSSNAVIEEFDPKYNCIELNNLQLEIPADVILKHAPREMVSAIQAYQNANGWNGFFSFVKKAFNYVKKHKGAIKQAVAYVKQGIGIAKLFLGEDGKPVRCEYYIVNNLDDLMAARQNDLPGELRKLMMSCVSPQAGSIISRRGDLFEGTTAARNGYTINDLNVVRCRNFTDICRHSGFDSIEAMLASERASNAVRYIVTPYISHGLGDLYDGKLTPVELAPGDIDYRDKIYPVDPVDLAVASMDATGIGGKKSVASTAFDPEDTNPESEFTTGAEFADDYSIGNSIPRRLVWVLDPDFVESGGTMENVGKYLHYAEFDFSRINLYLEDDAGFRVPCNTAAISVLNFDTTTPGKSSTATLKFFGQGSTQLTAEFPYSVESTGVVKTLLSATAVKRVMQYSSLNPDWITNVVSDSALSDEGYKNACTLIPHGWTSDIGQGRLDTVGAHDIKLSSITGGVGISSTITVEVVDPLTDLSVDEINARYKFSGWLSSANGAMVVGKDLFRREVMFTIIDTYTNLPVYYGNADSSNPFISEVFLNGISLMHDAPTSSDNPAGVNRLRVGANSILIKTTLPGLEWSFTHIANVDATGLTLDIDPESTWVTEHNLLNIGLTPSDINMPEESFLFGAGREEAGAITQSDVIAKVQNPGSMLPITLSSSEFGLEAAMPYRYDFVDDRWEPTGEPLIGVAIVKPCAVRPGGTATEVNAGYVKGRAWLVHRKFPQDDLRVELEGQHGWWAEGYKVMPGTYIDLSKLTMSLHFTVADEAGTAISQNPVFVDGESFLWTPEPVKSSSVWERYVYVPADVTGTEFVFSSELPDHINTGQVMKKLVVEVPILEGGPAVGINVKLIGDYEKATTGHYVLPYGTQLTPDSLEVTAVRADGSEVPLTGNISITSYFPHQIGAQTVTVVYGYGEHTFVKDIDVMIRRPKFTDLRAKPKTSRYSRGQAITAADFEVTGTTEEGIEVPIAPNDVEAVEFDTGGAENQTGMTALRYIGDGGRQSERCTGNYRYDTGLGGGNTEFNLPAFVAPHSRPYCFKGDITRDFGLTSPFMVAPDNGDRTPVDPQLVSMDPVDTSQAGTVEVMVYLREGNWRVCRK